MGDMAAKMIRETDAVAEATKPQLAAAIAAAMDELFSVVRTGNLYAPLPPASREAIINAISITWTESGRAASSIFREELATGFKTEEIDRVTSLVTDYVNNYGAQRARNILTTTERQVRDLVTGGLRQGQAQSAVFSAFVNKIPALADTRAELITATEAHTVAQYTSQLLARQSGVVRTKTWVTAQDDRVRDFRKGEFNHRQMHGVSVRLEEGFQTPTLFGAFEILQFPGDPAGSAGNVINCRCVQTYERL